MAKVKITKDFQLPTIDYTNNESTNRIEEETALITNTPPEINISEVKEETPTVLKDVAISDKNITYSFNAMKDTNFSILQVRNMIELYNVNETKSRVVKLNNDSTEKLKLVSTVLGKKFSMEALINIIVKFGADVIYEDLKTTKELKEFMKNFKM